MGDDLEELLQTVATKVYESAKNYVMTDRDYEKAMSEELLDRDIKFEAHKKVYDERRGKYKFIHLFFPTYKKFIKIKARKYITRTEINELKEDEQVMGMEGMIINFYNGVNIRHSTSGRVRPEYDPVPLINNHTEQKHMKPRMTLPHLSGSTSRLSDFAEPVSFRPHGNKLSKYHLTALPLSDSRDSYHNTDKIFALSCAAFFFSEGDRKEFVEIFNELLESMKLEKIDVPDKLLHDSKMKTPDGEVIEAIHKAFSSKSAHKYKKEHKQEDSRNHSPEKNAHKDEIDDEDEEE